MTYPLDGAPFFAFLARFEGDAVDSLEFMKREKISLCLSKYSRRFVAGASGSVVVLLLALVDETSESFCARQSTQQKISINTFRVLMKSLLKYKETHRILVCVGWRWVLRHRFRHAGQWWGGNCQIKPSTWSFIQLNDQLVGGCAHGGGLYSEIRGCLRLCGCSCWTKKIARRETRANKIHKQMRNVEKKSGISYTESFTMVVSICV